MNIETASMFGSGVHKFVFALEEFEFSEHD
jgi:hypothetical protein